jgi:hypothetical protein
MTTHITAGSFAALSGNTPRIVEMLPGEYSLTSPSALFYRQGRIFISPYMDKGTDWSGANCIIYHGLDKRWYVVLNSSFTRHNQIKILPDKPGQMAHEVELLPAWRFLLRCLMFRWFHRPLVHETHRFKNQT